MGNAAYDERRRLEADNKLMHEQKFNERLKREALAERMMEVVSEGLIAFFSGKAAIVISEADSVGGRIVSFEMPSKPTEG